MIVHSLQKFLFFGTRFVIWLKHRKVMKQGGFTFGRFWGETWHCVHAGLRMMAPNSHSVAKVVNA